MVVDKMVEDHELVLDSFTEKYFDTVKNIALALGFRGYPDYGVEDLAQDVAMKMIGNFRRNPEFYDPTKGKISTLIGMVTRNLQIDAFRKRTRRPTVELPNDDEDDSGVLDNLGYREAAIEYGRIKERELLVEVLDKTKELTEKQRDAIINCGFLGESLKDYSERKGIGFSASSYRVLGARSKLRGLLEND
jgi:RNA polymerase sigma factor (sigma-70 family)